MYALFPRLCFKSGLILFFSRGECLDTRSFMNPPNNHERCSLEQFNAQKIRNFEKSVLFCYGVIEICKSLIGNLLKSNLIRKVQIRVFESASIYSLISIIDFSYFYSTQISIPKSKKGKRKNDRKKVLQNIKKKKKKVLCFILFSKFLENVAINFCQILTEAWCDIDESNDTKPRKIERFNLEI